MTTFNPSYTNQRHDITSLVPAHALRILDIGCSTGDVGAVLKAVRPNRQIVGIELDVAMARRAANELDLVFQADVIAFDWTRLTGAQFDCILCADILEHLADPETTLAQAALHLAPDGCLILSVPNVRHISVWYWVFVRGRWPLRERGIFDRTHLRWFTLTSLYDLLAIVNLITKK